RTASRLPANWRDRTASSSRAGRFTSVTARITAFSRCRFNRRTPDMEKDMTRRKLLQKAGWAIAAAAFPYPYIKVAAAQETSPAVDKLPVSSVMNKLSTYMAEARGRGLPADVV